MPIDNPAIVVPGAALVITEIEVFNGASPTVWTDLDLSAVVGANPALVVLKVYTGGASRDIAFRKNGDTDQFYDTDTTSARGAALVFTKPFCVVIVATDADGIVEWITDVSYATTTIDVIAYIK